MQAYDSLEYFDELKAAGVPENQARVQANELRILNELATKDGLEKVHNELKGEIQDVRNELKGDIQDVRNEVQDVHNDIKGIHMELKEMMRWGISMFAGMVALMITLFGIGIAIFLK